MEKNVIYWKAFSNAEKVNASLIIEQYLLSFIFHLSKLSNFPFLESTFAANILLYMLAILHLLPESCSQ